MTTSVTVKNNGPDRVKLERVDPASGQPVYAGDAPVLNPGDEATEYVHDGQALSIKEVL